MEDQVVDVLVAQVCVRCNQAVLDRLGLDPLAVDAGAVIGNLDDDAAGTVLGAEAQHAFGVLAEFGALLGPFQPVVDRVADHVGQRLGDLVDDRLVDFGVFTFGDQSDLLAGHVGNFAYDPAHPLEHRFDRLGADGHHAVLDLPGQLLQFFKSKVDGGRAAAFVFNHALRQHGLVDHQLTDEVDQTVNPVKIDTNGLRCGGNRGNHGFLFLGFGNRLGCKRQVCGSQCRLAGCSGRCRGSGRFGGNRRLIFQQRQVERDSCHRLVFAGCGRGSKCLLIGTRRDFNGGIPLDEFEHVANGFFVTFGFNPDQPGEVGTFRIEHVERRQIVGLAPNLQVAELGEFAQDEDRLVALRIKIGTGLEANREHRATAVYSQFILAIERVEAERNRLETAVVGGFGCFGGRSRRFGLGGFRRRGGRSGSRSRQGLSLGVGFEFRHQTRGTGALDGAAVTGCSGQVGKYVRRPEHDLEQVLRGFKLVGSNAIKCCLEHVSEGDEIIEAEGPCTTLDRMHGAENRVDRFRIGVAIIESEQTGFQFSELFLAFLEEDLLDFIHIHGEDPVRRLHARWLRSASMGQRALQSSRLRQLHERGSSFPRRSRW